MSRWLSSRVASQRDAVKVAQQFIAGFTGSRLIFESCKDD